jgi:tRNA pseudouridine55 synthase
MPVSIGTRYNTLMQDGFLPVNKPIGLSTFDVIRVFKRHTGFKGKVGHAGTLDVFAEGLVILMLGGATKQFDQWQTHEKVYTAGVRLGVESNTLDVEGQLVLQAQLPEHYPSYSELQPVLESFVGEYEQAVPSFSAAKQDGQPLYKLARQGEEIIAKKKLVKINSIELIAYKFPLVTLRASCSSGTYIRQLTFDIFQKLGYDSFLFSLKREQIGEVTLVQACELEAFDSGAWESKVF